MAILLFDNMSVCLSMPLTVRKEPFKVFKTRFTRSVPVPQLTANEG